MPTALELVMITPRITGRPEQDRAMNETKEQQSPDDAAPVHPACSASGEVESNFGKAFNGWWWGVWQDGRIVGFGAGYKRKARCFRHERECLESARQRAMPTVECQSNVVERRVRR